MLDVSRYKYNAWWTPLDLLWESVLPSDSSDPSSQGRGLVFAWSLSTSASPRLGPDFITPSLDNNEPILVPTCPSNGGNGQASATLIIWIVLLVDFAVILVAGLVLMRAGVLRVDLLRPRASESPNCKGEDRPSSRSDAAAGIERKGGELTGEGSREVLGYDAEKGSTHEHISETMPLVAAVAIAKKD